MRIIGGKNGGRKIRPPAKMPFTRPTTDIAKEGLFNILENHLNFAGLKTLDLFGGTGSISYELASRGASNLTIVEKDLSMHAFIKKTGEHLYPRLFRVLRMEVFRFLEQYNDSFDFIFAGPPYSLKRIDELPGLILNRNFLNPGGWFVLEHTPRNNFEGCPFFSAQRHYGTTVFSFFVKPSEN